MALLDFAKSELNLLLNKCEDDESREMQQRMNNGILEVVKVFSEAGHSGFSANYALGIIDRLLRFKPLSALTGEEHEWNDVSELYDNKKCYQNKRCPSVFKDDDHVYNVEGKIFSDDGGETWYTCRESSVDIQFPYDVPLYPENVIKNKEE